MSSRQVLQYLKYIGLVSVLLAFCVLIQHGFWNSSLSRHGNTVCHCPNMESKNKPSAKTVCQTIDNSELERLSMKQTNLDISTFSAYSRFSLGWLGKVEELDWAEKHSMMSGSTDDSHTPLSIYDDITEANQTKDSHITRNDYIYVSTGKMGMTSITNTRVYFFDGKSTYKPGDYIHVVIEAYDDNGRRRLRGGDFFEPVMYNTNLKMSTAGRVVDYGNGTYSVYFYASWRGSARFNITQAFTREAILFINHDIAYKEVEGLWQANFTNGRSSELTNCTVVSEGTWSDKCEYTKPTSLGNTRVICRKTKHLKCEDFYSTLHAIQKIEPITETRIGDSDFLFESGKLHLATIEATITGASVKPKLQRCGPDMPVSLSDGYWVDHDTFVPLICRSQQWREQDARQCLSKKMIFMSGGSTMRHVLQSFQENFPFPDYSIDFHFVAMRLGHMFQNVDSYIFESDVLDGIHQDICDSNSDNIVFIVNFSFHFVTWTTNAYLERIFKAKLALGRFLNRCPGATVLIRLSNPRENMSVQQRVHSSDWILYDQNRMIRRVFGGMGVRFIDVWDMVLSHPLPNVVHMPMHVIRQQVMMMLSYICPDMVKDK